MKMDKHLTDKELAQKAYCLLDITSAGLFGAYGWNIKGRSITSKTAPGCRYTRIWYLNGVRIQYRYIQLLTYKLLGLI